MEMKYESIVGVLEDSDYVVLDKVFEHKDSFRGATGSRFHPVDENERRYRTSTEVAMEHFEDFWEELYHKKPGFDRSGNVYTSGEDFPSLYDFTEEALNEQGDEAVFDLSYYDVGCQVAALHTERLAKSKGISVQEFKEKFPDEVCEISECTGGGRCFSYKMDWAEIFDKKALKLALSFERLADYDEGWEEELSKHMNRADIEGIKRRMVA
jgi:hypothetical protein